MKIISTIMQNLSISFVFLFIMLCLATRCRNLNLEKTYYENMIAKKDIKTVKIICRYKYFEEYRNCLKEQIMLSKGVCYDVNKLK